jgi:hypothetical protein
MINLRGPHFWRIVLRSHFWDLPSLMSTQIGARDFLASLESPQRPLILDVRVAPEWSHVHLEGAVHILQK